jgi:hypothetical protein
MRVQELRVRPQLQISSLSKLGSAVLDWNMIKKYDLKWGDGLPGVREE